MARWVYPKYDDAKNIAMMKTITIAGVDEAGRGPLAGPVVAAAVILPDNHNIIGLDDSKKLSPIKRSALEAQIIEGCDYAIGMAEPDEIDRINILQATLVSMKRAVDGLQQKPDHILVDGNRLPQWDYSAEFVIGGDALHANISAASIIAKEYRDRLMIEADKKYPQYGWASNKGYGSKVHMEAIKTFGPTPYHRKSFAPMSQMTLDI